MILMNQSLNPKKYGKVTPELIKNIKELEKKIATLNHS